MNVFTIVKYYFAHYYFLRILINIFIFFFFSSQGTNRRWTLHFANMENIHHVSRVCVFSLQSFCFDTNQYIFIYTCSNLTHIYIKLVHGNTLYLNFFFNIFIYTSFFDHKTHRCVHPLILCC